MRAVVQRVSRASVAIDGDIRASIGKGMLILLGISRDDTSEDAAYIAGKLARLRIFADDRGLMNLSVKEGGGEVIVVSQFTILAGTRKGNRPSFSQAAEPARAQELYEEVIALLRREGLKVGTGEFGAMMDVELVNDGPVTIIVDSR